jgi:hypothetical protein
MDIHLTEEPFGLLDLPRELRDRIYEYALGFSSCRTDPYSINEYSRVHAEAPIVKRRCLGINLLLANKQIHDEAKPILLKSNPLVRVAVQNAAGMCDWLHGPGQPIHVLSIAMIEKQLRTSGFPRFTMELDMWIESSIGEWDGGLPKNILVMLWTDFCEFCKRVEIERMHSDTRALPKNECVRLRVKLGAAVSTSEEGGSVVNPRSVQERLLRPIQDGIRGSPGLTIEGCSYEDLVQDTIQSVKQSYWPDAQVLLTELSIQREEAEDAEQDKNDLACVVACTEGISTIDRLCIDMVYFEDRYPPIHIRAILHAVKEHHYYFHVTIARCLLAQLKQLFQPEHFQAGDLEKIAAVYADIKHVLRCIVQRDPREPSAYPHRPARRPWFPTFRYRTCCFPCHEAFFLLESAGRIVLESDGASSVYARDKGHFIYETREYLRKALETEWVNKVYQEESRRLEQVVGADPYLEQERPVVTKCLACGPPPEDGMARMRRRLDRIR